MAKRPHPLHARLVDRGGEAVAPGGAGSYREEPERLFRVACDPRQIKYPVRGEALLTTRKVLRFRTPENVNIAHLELFGGLSKPTFTHRCCYGAKRKTTVIRLLGRRSSCLPLSLANQSRRQPCRLRSRQPASPASPTAAKATVEGSGTTATLTTLPTSGVIPAPASVP